MNKNQKDKSAATNYNLSDWNIDDSICSNKNKEKTDTSNHTGYEYESEEDISSNNSGSKSVAKPKKKISKVILIIILILFLLSVAFICLTALSQKSNANSSNTTNNSQSAATVQTTQSTTESEDNYPSGQCGDNAYYHISNDSVDDDLYYVLNIDGNGSLWDWESCNWNFDVAEIKEIVVGNEITSVGESQFCEFENVEQISFRESVEHIGRNACAGLDSLKYVYVENTDCEIDFDDGEYIYDTLGNSDGSVTIICNKGSTADEIAKIFNDNYSNAYTLEYYD